MGVKNVVIYYECKIGKSSFKLCPAPKNIHNEDYCSDCWNEDKMKPFYNFPAFTAEKQIELIKLLMKAGCFTGYAYKTVVKKYMLSCKLKNYYNEDFAEALAGLILRLIEAGELDKDEVRKVLK